MSPDIVDIIAAASIVAAVLSAFAAGVLYARHVLADVQSIKTHVSSEVAAVRGELRNFLEHAAQKL